MEMGNDYMPELHVAQQRRRDKLRVQQLEDLPHNNFNHNSSSMLFPTEMLNFPASSHSAQFANVHPLRFVAPSSSDSCDPQPLQICDDWVSNYGEHGRRNLMMSHHFSVHNSNSNTNHGSTTGNEVLAAHYYQNNVHGWETGENNELPLLPTFVSPGNDSSALSLSLSSSQIREMHCYSEPRELKPLESGSISSVVKSDLGKSQMQDVVAPANHMYRNVGPLGPFTGYATILRGPKFLKPAQILLDEFLTAAGLRHTRGSEEVESVPTSTVLGPRFFGSNGISSGSPSGDTHRPNCDEKKAKLLQMQEEVCKRHKQYHQQMEMVVSAFESVPGLSNATPYISRSLKTISRNFRSLKNAIADQIRLIKRTLGEDFSTPTSYIKSNDSCLRFDQSIAKIKTTAVGGIGYGGGHQSHIWRPQRGLPERAVSVLRAWLFDHFLHPYPTDSDKQMLASQTGLSRNQVSNWFINARVRLWKPMVEEIHMLETKGTGRSEPNPNHKLAAGSHKPVLNAAICDAKHLDRMGSSSYMEAPRGESNTEKLHQKISRIESHQIPPNIGNSFHGFLPYDRRGLELGSLGAVSLTLGLRHGSETMHQQQLQNQFQQQGLQHYGGHVMHDFTG